MARIDPDDDTVRRFVIQHYRFDESRNHRRHVTIAAFDNQAEFEAEIWRRIADLNERKRLGLAEPVEHLSGPVLEPGHRERARQARRARQDPG